MIRLNKSVLDGNTVLCNEEKLLIEHIHLEEEKVRKSADAMR